MRPSLVPLFALLLTSLLALTSTSALAAPGWISDTLYVPMRSGAGSQFRIVHRGLKSGTRLEVIAMEEGSEWAQVRFDDIEGYINSQYVVRSAPAMIRLDQLQAQHQKVTQQLTEVREQVTSLSKERDQLKAENQRLTGNLGEQSQQLNELEEIAADPIRLDQANRELNEHLSKLRTELNGVSAENTLLRSDKTSSMWLVGASILIGGWLVGWLMRSRSARSRSSWS